MSHENITSSNTEPFERIEDGAFEQLQLRRRQVMMIRSFMVKSKDYRKPHLENALRSRAAYENWHQESRSLTKRARLKLPFGFTIIETQVPQLVDIFLQDERIIEFKGQGPDDTTFENVLSDFHVHQLQEMEFRRKFPEYIKAMLLDGIAIAKIPYVFEEREIKTSRFEVDPVTGDQTKVTEEQLFKIKEGPGFELVNIEDFFPDWSTKNAGEIQEQRGCVHRVYKTFAEIKANAKRSADDDKGIYSNLSELRISLGTKGNKAWDKAFFDDRFKRDFEHFRSEQHRTNLKDSDKIELWEYWGMFDLKGDGNFQEWLITLANGDVVIRAERNFYDYQFKPFIACPNIIRPGEFYGLPELLSVHSIIKEMNTLRNARLDNVNLSVNPMWIYDRASGINPRSIYSRPNGLIASNDINGLKPLQLPDPSLGSLQELQRGEQDINNAIGHLANTPQLSQLGKTFGRSATGVEFINNISSSRIGSKGRQLSDFALRPMARIMLMTNRQFTPPDKFVRVLDPALRQDGNPFADLDQEAFFRNFDFVVQTDIETGGPQAQMAKIEQTARLIQVLEASQPFTFKAGALADIALRPLWGAQSPRFVNTEEERQQLVQQQQEQLQALNQQQGAAAPQPNAGEGAGGLAALLGGQ